MAFKPHPDRTGPKHLMCVSLVTWPITSQSYSITVTSDLCVRLRSSGLWFLAVQQFDLVKVSRFDHLIVQMQQFTFGLATRKRHKEKGKSSSRDSRPAFRILHRNRSVVLPSSRQHEVCSVNHSRVWGTSPLIIHLYHLKNNFKTSQYFLRETPSWYGKQTWDTNIRPWSVGVEERGRRFAWGMIGCYTENFITTFTGESHQTSKKHDVFIQNQQEEINDIFALRKWWLF